MVVLRGSLATLVALFLGAGTAFAGASDVEPNDSLVAPEVQDIDDPFRRGIDRIADQATNIAEDVVFLCTGEIVRHTAAVRELAEDIPAS